MTSLEWGGALSTFAENYGDDGRQINKIFEFSTIGLPIQSLIRILNLSPPQSLQSQLALLTNLLQLSLKSSNLI